MRALLLVSGALALPSVDDLAGEWLDPNEPVSVRAGLGAAARDLGVVNNFWGSAGVAPQGVRPVDLVGVNSLELPPFVGCGAGQPCGRLSLGGAAVTANSTKWAAYEVLSAGHSGRNAGHWS